MQHSYFGRKLNRDVKERKALFRSLLAALILRGRIKTTVAKAKAIRSLAEKLVTAAKDGSFAAVNQLSSFLVRKELIEKLRNDIAPRFTEKIGGYLRIIRLGQRIGDGSEQVIVEWTVEAGKKVEPAVAKAVAGKKVEKVVKVVKGTKKPDKKQASVKQRKKRQAKKKNK